MSDVSVVEKSTFDSYVNKIRKEVNSLANNWFHIAYYVYEMKYFKTYVEGGYNNIVDCCFAEFGFKKSTTYNFIKIVEQFGKKFYFVPLQGACSTQLSYVCYVDFMAAVRGWSYSQLVSMLSLSADERDKATPEMSSREIKMLKSSEDSKRLESSCDSSDELKELSARLNNLQNDFDQLNDLYLAERSSNHRINIKLVDMTSERDLYLDKSQQLEADNKKLKAEIKRLKAELKAYQNKS